MRRALIYNRGQSGKQFMNELRSSGPNFYGLLRGARIARAC